MKNQKLGFTLIELLVVIVIIGILATISTATFSGYFTKARDSERQTFVRNAQQIILADQVTADTADYRLGGTTGALVDGAVDTALSTQGYTVPAAKNSINYFYITNSNGTAAYDTLASDFLFFACIEDSLGTAISGTGTDDATAADIASVAYTAGTAGTGWITKANLQTACAATPAAPTVEAEWDAENLNA